MEFNDIYMNATYNMQSSANEVDVIAKARQIYKEKVNRAFANEAFWEILKNKPKWFVLKSADDLWVCPKEAELLSQSIVNLLMRVSELASTTTIDIKC